MLRNSVETAFEALAKISKRAKELEAEIRRDWSDQMMP